MDIREAGILRFDEQYFERIWGGRRLASKFDKPLPPDKPIGEAWMISDHPQCVSVVSQGPFEGRSLRQLLEHDAQAVLGDRAQLTVHGRFPLLLKLLDARDVLSVQVHPDDETARRLGEPDVGKTEMWHVLETAAGSELICGMDPSVTREQFAEAMSDGRIEQMMTRFEVESGTSVFVPAGTVHAIGSGIMLAEIQQNSDLTYRVYDWGRLQDNGQARELHVDKALEALHFGSSFGGQASPLSYEQGTATRTVLAACRYFAAECITIDGEYWRETRGDSFHIVLAKADDLLVCDAASELRLERGQAALVPGHVEGFTLLGQGEILDYYVPALETDIIEPLEAAGHSQESIARLGGVPGQSDVKR